MQALIEHLLQPLLQHPDDMQLNVIEGKASLLVQLKVHDDDVDVVLGNDEAHIHAIRHILSIASGKRKPSLELVQGEFQVAEEANEEAAAETAEAVDGAEGETSEESAAAEDSGEAEEEAE